MQSVFLFVKMFLIKNMFSNIHLFHSITDFYSSLMQIYNSFEQLGYARFPDFLENFTKDKILWCLRSVVCFSWISI